MNLTKLIKLICAGAIVGACLLPTACEINTTVNKQGDTTIIEGYGEGYTKKDDGTVVSDASQVDFTNYVSFKNEATFSVKVRNNTLKRLIAFKGAPDESTLLSGIPSSATNWGLKYKSDLFTGSNDFILYIVTEEDYLEHKNNLRELEYYPFAKIYAFYNANSDGTNNNVYDISKNMGGTCTITLTNANGTNNVELRSGSITGETIGYAQAYSAQTVFKVDPGTYFIYPVYRKYSSILNEIVTQYPKTPEGYAVVKMFQLTDNDPNAQITASGWDNSEFSPSSAYIKVTNNTENGLQVYDGANSTALMTTDGGEMINSGKSKVYRVDMDLLSGTATNNPKYNTFKSYAMYTVGSPMAERKYLTTNSTSTATTKKFNYEAGKLYEVTISSDGTSYGFTIDPTSDWTVSAVQW